MLRQPTPYPKDLKQLAHVAKKSRTKVQENEDKDVRKTAAERRHSDTPSTRNSVANEEVNTHNVVTLTGVYNVPKCLFYSGYLVYFLPGILRYF